MLDTGGSPPLAGIQTHACITRNRLDRHHPAPRAERKPPPDQRLYDASGVPLLSVTRRIADSGCNLVDARLATVGRDVSVTALATGSWDSVAKLEAMLTRLEREEGLKLVWYRTAAKQAQSNLLPYIVEVIAADKPGILFQLADFFDRQGITIENLQSTRYRAMQTGAEMFSAQVTIGVPANMHIAALRDDFLEFCDHLNLDAIMDPMKNS
jgi:glycine cleavage system transcriptional repressor